MTLRGERIHKPSRQFASQAQQKCERLAPPVSPIAAVLNLQKTIGNRGVQRLLQNREQRVHWQPLATEPGAGQPLTSDTLAVMQRRFGYDLSRVRIHTDSPTANALGAKAFTSGQHIWFATGHGPSDHRLLAHEMAHVVEQATGGAAGVTQFDFEEDVLKELRRLPSAEVEGLSDAERRRRLKVILDRRQRLRELFRKLSGKEAAAVHDRLVKRKRGDVLSERFHDLLAEATRREMLEILDQDILDAPPSAADFCKPYTAAELRVLLDHFDSKAMLEFADDWIAIVYGQETADLFTEYLSRTKGDSLAPKIFDDPASEIVSAFVGDPATQQRQKELLSSFEKAMIGKCPNLPAGVWTDVDLSKLLPSAVLNQGFSFSGPTIPTIPGLIAGGISASDAGNGFPQCRRQRADAAYS